MEKVSVRIKDTWKRQKSDLKQDKFKMKNEEDHLVENNTSENDHKVSSNRRLLPIPDTIQERATITFTECVLYIFLSQRCQTLMHQIFGKRKQTKYHMRSARKAKAPRR